MTLQNLETYRYIGSKSKSYWILREFLLLFIFHAFWPYKAGLSCFLVFWPYKAGLLCFFAFWLYKACFPYFLICFPFYWELLGLCLRVNWVPTISWIITEYLTIYLAALDFFYSDQINHPTRSMHIMLLKCRHPIVPYLLRPASRAIGHQTFLVPNWGYDPKKVLDQLITILEPTAQ